MRAYSHICTHIRIYANTYADMSAYTHVGSKYRCTYAYIWTHVRVYAHIYAYMRAFTHIWTLSSDFIKALKIARTADSFYTLHIGFGKSAPSKPVSPCISPAVIAHVLISGVWEPSW